jgi:hypothetical protein
MYGLSQKFKQTPKAKQAAKLKQAAKIKQALREASRYCEEIHIEIKHDHPNLVIRVDGLDARSKKKERVSIPPEQQARLAKIVAGTAGKEGRDANAAFLTTPTSLDTLTVATELIVTPQTLMPKLLGFLAKMAVLHFLASPLAIAQIGMSHKVVKDLAKLAGEAVEQAAKPAFKSHGILGNAMAAMKDFDVTFDLAKADLTPAVMDSAASHLTHTIINPPESTQPVQGSPWGQYTPKESRDST